MSPRASLELYELRLPDGYDAIGPAPISIVDSNGHVIATVGDNIEVVGELPSSYGTFCMIGPVLQATEIRALHQ
jgi:hypothetical protein